VALAEIELARVHRAVDSASKINRFDFLNFARTASFRLVHSLKLC
jgi:hypothetical protein